MGHDVKCKDTHAWSEFVIDFLQIYKVKICENYFSNIQSHKWSHLKERANL